ncbi:hypothetical protein GCK72_018967 [Caenorhabditis remanei]|uniref:T20D4.11-like domain-containing protein n=1 Tax=Caenorhabditis remanei TaxID=31234 RepID=A0A6A5GD86_CAERE|nr:hypothetical protein GCK72_018967 [Caenorhabditis remanei]KAF1752412.1 hypothetical protein GCK72_018967 [Caenorhabditis remanei]
MKGGGCFLIWLCLAMITIPFYVFRAQSYIFHGKLGCSAVFHEANGLIENELNDTKWLLKIPDYYSNISKSCLEADKCSHVIRNSVEHSGLTLSGVCPFYVYYNGPFSKCADRLIYNFGQNVSCIHVIFGTGFEISDKMCEEWSNLQNCLLDEIQSTCQDVLTTNSTEPIKYFNMLKTEFCGNLGNSSLVIEQKDSDTSEELLEEQEVEGIV